MRNLKKKGFTIVELVIVVAVIAILAAVLIPTFSSLVKKANMSADQVAVKNMNTILAIMEVENDEPTFQQVKTVLEAAGFKAEDYRPLSEGTAFYWVPELNKIVLFDETTQKVLYPTNLEDGLVYNEDWKPLISDKNLIFPEDAPIANVSLCTDNDFFNSLPGTGQYYTFRTLDHNNEDAPQSIKDQREKYGDWWADFTIIINDDFRAGTGGIAGAYWNLKEEMPLLDDLEAGFSFNLLDLIEDGGYFGFITYELLLSACAPKENGERDGFNCGAYNTSNDNIGKSITVQLRLYKPTFDDDGNYIRGEYIICEEIHCEF